MRLLRFVLLVAICLVSIATVIAIGRPETGPWEKALLGVVLVGILFVAARVGRLGRPRTVP